MVDFNTSKANQIIAMSKGTRDLLEAIFNADLPFRNNLATLEVGTPMDVKGDSLQLFSSGHMLGSSQVRITCADGYRLGYSSDFFWPLDPVVEVDELLVDATYGDPLRSRSYTQEQAESCYLGLLSGNLAARSRSVVVGHNGRLQHALYLAASMVPWPIVVSPKAFPLVEAYRRHGYAIPNVMRSDSVEGGILVRSTEPMVAFATLTELRHLSWIDGLRRIHLSAYASKLDDPVILYDNGDCCVAVTDHADFEGTIAYVEATRARRVWTDPRTGNAEALATAIREQLGIEARVVRTLDDHGWG